MPENQVVLTDEVDWHDVLNFWLSTDLKDDAPQEAWNAWEREYDAVNTLPFPEQYRVKSASWQHIFRSADDWQGSEFIQAAFWEMRPEYVVKIQPLTVRACPSSWGRPAELTDADLNQGSGAWPSLAEYREAKIDRLLSV